MKLIGNSRKIIISQIGQKHIQKGICNQDAFYQSEYDYHDQTYHVMAIADGHGGSQHALSHIGSAMASQLSVTYFIEACKTWYDIMSEEKASGFETGQEASYLLDFTYLELWRDDWFKAWREWTQEHYNQCAFDLPYQSSYYGSTLLFLAETPFGLVLAQIGDGSITILDAKDQLSLPLAVPSETHFDQTHSVSERFRDIYFDYQVIPSEAVKAVVMVTDGFENAFPYSQYDFMNAYGALLSQASTEDFKGAVEKVLLEATHYSGDDVTMAVLFNPSAEIQEKDLEVVLPDWERDENRRHLKAFKYFGKDPFDIRIIEGLLVIASQMKRWFDAQLQVSFCDLNHWYYDEAKGTVLYLNNNDESLLASHEKKVSVERSAFLENYYLKQLSHISKRLLREHTKYLDKPEKLRDLLDAQSLDGWIRQMKTYRQWIDIDYEVGRFQMNTSHFYAPRLRSQAYEMCLFEGASIRGWQLGLNYMMQNESLLQVVKHPKRSAWGVRNQTLAPITCYYEKSHQYKTIGPQGIATINQPMTIYVLGLPITIN